MTSLDINDTNGSGQIDEKKKKKNKKGTRQVSSPIDFFLRTGVVQSG